MAINRDPIFPIEGQSVGVLINAANAAADGSGTLFDLITGAENGTRVDGVIFTSSQTTAGASVAKVCRMFITNALGLNPLLIAEAVLPAKTRSNTVDGATVTCFFPKAIVLKQGQKIQVSQSVRATSADDTAAVPLAGNY